MVLMAFRHGLRVSELCDLQWLAIDFKAGTVQVRRGKGSKDSTRYLEGDESRPLKTLHKASESPYVSPESGLLQCTRLGLLCAAGSMGRCNTL
jgi:integrase